MLASILAVQLDGCTETRLNVAYMDLRAFVRDFSGGSIHRDGRSVENKFCRHPGGLLEDGVARRPVTDLRNRLGGSADELHAAQVEIERPEKSAIAGKGDRLGWHGDLSTGEPDPELDVFPVWLRRQVLVLAHEEVAAVAIRTHGPVDRTADGGRARRHAG